MRIAVSGTHAIGKSTLVAELGERLPNHTVVPEPYELLEDRGYVFEHPPSVEDYIAQLRQSIAVLRHPAPNLIVDRSPLDFLGYIYASARPERFDLTPWVGPTSEVMASLDLLVALRIDSNHDPAVQDEDMVFRRLVDSRLRDIVDDDSFDLLDGVDVLILAGPWHHRAETVLRYAEATRGKQPGTLSL